MSLPPLVILLASAVRLLLIGNYDPAVAVTIAESRGVTNTLLGTTIPLLPPYLPIVALLLVSLRLYSYALACLAAALLVSPAYHSFNDVKQNGADQVRLLWRELNQAGVTQTAHRPP